MNIYKNKSGYYHYLQAQFLSSKADKKELGIHMNIIT